jgi:hypothetical protein
VKLCERFPHNRRSLSAVDLHTVAASAPRQRRGWISLFQERHVNPRSQTAPIGAVNGARSPLPTRRSSGKMPKMPIWHPVTGSARWLPAQIGQIGRVLQSSRACARTVTGKKWSLWLLALRSRQPGAYGRAPIASTAVGGNHGNDRYAVPPQGLLGKHTHFTRSQTSVATISLPMNGLTKGVVLYCR